MEEEKLSLDCAKGDADARRILYERYSKHLFGVCLRYSSGRDEALDLLHDAFIKIYSNIGKFSYRGGGSLKGWLTRLTINMALEKIRRESRLQKVGMTDEIVGPEPSEEVMEQIPSGVLLRFIEELPPGYRAVFNLYVFEELPHKEIARILQINEKSSSSQLLRAKAAVAKKIHNYLKNKENGKGQ